MKTQFIETAMDAIRMNLMANFDFDDRGQNVEHCSLTSGFSSNPMEYKVLTVCLSDGIVIVRYC